MGTLWQDGNRIGEVTQRDVADLHGDRIGRLGRVTAEHELRIARLERRCTAQRIEIARLTRALAAVRGHDGAMG